MAGDRKSNQANRRPTHRDGRSSRPVGDDDDSTSPARRTRHKNGRARHASTAGTATGRTTAADSGRGNSSNEQRRSRMTKTSEAVRKKIARALEKSGHFSAEQVASLT